MRKGHYFAWPSLMSQESRAEALIAEAQKKMKPTGLFSAFSTPRYDEAAELLGKAANAYKIAKKCEFSPPLLPQGLTLGLVFYRGKGWRDLLPSS